MITTLLKKDYKIIWISLKNPDKVIIELDKKTLSLLTSSKRRLNKKTENMSLREYVLSWEINNPANIEWIYNNIDDLILSLNKYKNYDN